MSESNIEQILTLVSLGAFILSGIFFGVISAVLNYHWTRYGIEAVQVKKIKRLYFGVTLALGIFMILTLLAIL